MVGSGMLTRDAECAGYQSAGPGFGARVAGMAVTWRATKIGLDINAYVQPVATISATSSGTSLVSHRNDV
jgi:hypothetical protein